MAPPVAKDTTVISVMVTTITYFDVVGLKCDCRLFLMDFGHAGYTV